MFSIINVGHIVAGHLVELTLGQLLYKIKLIKI